MLFHWLTSFHRPSYVVFFVTTACNARCKMCFYAGRMGINPAKDELTVDEYSRIARGLGHCHVVGISGGEPFLRQDLHQVVAAIYDNCSPLVLDLPTNGYFKDSILRQVELICRHCRKMTVDIQISIDGPEPVHDDIRQVKGGFRRMMETYRCLLELRKKFSNLRLKACVVYSAYNQASMPELFDLIERDMSGVDRLVFSVAHGTPANQEAFDFDWDRYFALCDRLRDSPLTKGGKDFHSVLTQALRVVKNGFLRNILKTKDMYRYCRAGSGVVAVSETGDVFPCEPLWRSVGNLRKTGYDMGAILRSREMREFQQDIRRQCCHCHWGIPMTNAVLFSPRYYPQIAGEMGRLMMANRHCIAKGR
ncbi:MAG: radical SAM protein [Candidatus Omnitrophota bacterium]